MPYRGPVEVAGGWGWVEARAKDLPIADVVGGAVEFVGAGGPEVVGFGLAGGFFIRRKLGVVEGGGASD
jgi:hypothetical protein